MNLSAFLWSVADLLRGKYRPHEYGKVILPFTVLRRMDCVLEPTKDAVLAELKKHGKGGLPADPYLRRASKASFYNTAPMDLKAIAGDPANVAGNLLSYLNAFSSDVADIFERFEMPAQIDRLQKADLLYLIVEKFASIDLHPKTVDNHTMGSVFEELIRKFAELSNETAGEHFTPRDVIRLMADLLFIEDDDALSKPGVVRTIYDPAAGTGGMLSVAGDYLEQHGARVVMVGQELNDESYAICKADMLIKGQDVRRIKPGDTLANDGHVGETFDYMLSNPPFGVEWKQSEKAVRREYEQMGYNGRFGPGLPRISDGSLLFMLHLVKKMRPVKDGGARFIIVQNGSPLFTGGAGSGESEIRRYLLESDLVEAIVALPTEMFFNTGIATYLWIVTNHKSPERKGKLQLIDASSFFTKMRPSLGSKRRELADAHIREITRIFGEFRELHIPNPKGNGPEVPISLIFPTESFGYRTITVERPLRDEKGKVVLGTKGKLKGKSMPDANLRDTENVPLGEDVNEYFEREVLRHAPDAWIDHEKTKVGYEIPFNRHFYVFEPPRELAEIDADLKVVTANIQKMLAELSA
jgi:type I restriction enzyme M protein